MKISLQQVEPEPSRTFESSESFYIENLEKRVFWKLTWGLCVPEWMLIIGCDGTWVLSVISD